MKKVFLCIVLAFVLCTCGCKQEISYVTKYVGNCETTELKEEPVNSSTTICFLNAGEAVSYHKDVENGYSKVAFGGYEGYILSTNIVDKKIETKVSSSSPSNISDQKDGADKKTETPQKSDSVEEFIAKYTRPMYNYINSNIDSFSKSTSGNATVWSDNNGIVKKEYPNGADGYEMARQYYYDSNNGNMIFAFFFDGSNEQRLYFDGNSLIRYIDNSGTVYDNPQHDVAFHYATQAMNEAY